MRPRTARWTRIESARARCALLLCGLFLAACAGADARDEEDGERLRVLVQDYGTGQHFELASETHTNRVEYYSELRAEASRKIQTDEVMALLVEELDRSGFERYAQSGRAPTKGGEAVTRSIEIEDGDETQHWLIGNGSSLEERKAFNDCLTQFLDLYNISASFQSVANPKGHEFFERDGTQAASPADKP